MADLTTEYLGLKLKNPIIVASSGLSNSTDKIKRLEEHGAGAVVLKSLYEEQLLLNTAFETEQYLKLIREAKTQTHIPIIASINCTSINDWVQVVRQIEDAGADALEVNVFYLPTDRDFRSDDYEKIYTDIVLKLSTIVKIPISIKLAPYFTNLLHVVDQVYYRGAKGVVLFNRFYEPDIDIESMEFKPAHLFSAQTDIYRTIRWTGIISAQLPNIDIAASCGIHDGQAAVKALLAGAKAAMVCSSLYMCGAQHLTSIITDIEQWMNRKGFSKLEHFRGAMNYGNVGDPQVYERTQFIKYFAGIQ